MIDTYDVLDHETKRRKASFRTRLGTDTEAGRATRQDDLGEVLHHVGARVLSSLKHSLHVREATMAEKMKVYAIDEAVDDVEI